MNKIEEARRAGMAYALAKVIEARDSGKSDADAIQVLIDEIKFRNISKVPLQISKSDFDKFINETKETICNSILLMSCMTLHDEYGFNKVRLKRFMERFSLKTDCLISNYATWQDYRNIINEECGIDIELAEELVRMAHFDK